MSVGGWGKRGECICVLYTCELKRKLGGLTGLGKNPYDIIFYPFYPSRPKTSTYANSLDPDETARNEPSHQDLDCLPVGSEFLTGIPICNNGLVKIQGRK